MFVIEEEISVFVGSLTHTAQTDTREEKINCSCIAQANCRLQRKLMAPSFWDPLFTSLIERLAIQIGVFSLFSSSWLLNDRHQTLRWSVSKWPSFPCKKGINNYPIFFALVFSMGPKPLVCSDRIERKSAISFRSPPKVLLGLVAGGKSEGILFKSRDFWPSNRKAFLSGHNVAQWRKILSPWNKEWQWMCINCSDEPTVKPNPGQIIKIVDRDGFFPSFSPIDSLERVKPFILEMPSQYMVSWVGDKWFSAVDEFDSLYNENDMYNGITSLSTLHTLTEREKLHIMQNAIWQVEPFCPPGKLLRTKKVHEVKFFNLRQKGIQPQLINDIIEEK